MKNVKRIVTGLCLVLMMIGCLSMKTNAADRSGTTGSCKWELNGTTLTISGTGKMEDYKLTQTDKYSPPVSSAPWGTEITSVVIKKGVTSIGDFSFFMCPSLKTITIPDSVTCIGEGVVAYCENLQSITIPQNVTELRYGAFAGCKKIASITIPKGVKKITEALLAGCENLQSITLSENVTSIEAEAFTECTNLQSITIPNGVTSIDESAFEGCTSLTSIAIPKGVTKICESTFAGCENLKSVTISNGTTSIEAGAFTACVNLQNLTLPNSVTVIGEGAFSYCWKLQSVTLPQNLKELRDGAFARTGLTSITIPKGVAKICASSFLECENLKSVIISNGPTSIEVAAFSDCTNLQSITIPSSVKSFEEDVFEDCPQTLTISGVPGSYAETYAKANGIKFAVAPLTVTLSATTYTYDGNVKVPTVIVKDIDGTQRTKGTDYTVTYSNASSKNAGTYKVTVNFKGNYTGSKTLSYTISPVNASKVTAKLSTITYTYNGSARKPTVAVTNASGTKLTEGTDYSLTYASGRKNVGKYSVTITFKGNYSGTKTLSFTIKPKSTTLKKVTSGSKRFTVKWTKKTTQTTGYQIQYSTSSSFKNAKTVTVSRNKTTSKTIKNLKAKKKYYVRIRTYKTVNGTKYYSTWSSKKTVRTKK